ncbi:Proteasome subunit beta [Aphelenchoides bicaudatus]|nr:Proteasome subunit beta [Aphelenchoides bicaudatus]
MSDLAFEGRPLANMNAFRDAMHDAIAHPVWESKVKQHANRWNPYSMEGGSTCAIAGDNFVVIGTDTRISYNEMSVLNRTAEKLHSLNDNIILATGGFVGDAIQMRRVLNSRLHKFRFDYRCDMTVDLCAELLARNLYYKRFFPYYTQAVLCGIDEEGEGAVYSFDPIGCIERVPCSSSGNAESLIQPFLDNQIYQEHQSVAADKQKLTLERAIGIVKDSFKLACEREVSVGDNIELVIAEHGKPTKRLIIPLRED